MQIKWITVSLLLKIIFKHDIHRMAIFYICVVFYCKLCLLFIIANILNYILYFLFNLFSEYSEPILLSISVNLQFLYYCDLVSECGYCCCYWILLSKKVTKGYSTLR